MEWSSCLKKIASEIILAFLVRLFADVALVSTGFEQHVQEIPWKSESELPKIREESD